MAGGIGSRFWPMSRTQHPKQFLDILGTGQTLIQQTYSRLKKICPEENIYIVTNEMYEDLILEQLPGITSAQIICEPSRRNTAPCIAYANYKIAEKNPNANNDKIFEFLKKRSIQKGIKKTKFGWIPDPLDDYLIN